MKFLLALALLSAAMFGQSRYSSTTGDVSLTGAGTSFTLQQPASGGKLLQLESAIVYCSVVCNVTQAANGAAATATAGTVTAIPPQGPPASATVWTASNVGAGTAAGGIVHIAIAPNTVNLDLSKVSFGPGTGAGANYTVSVSSITGTANITLIWSEK